MLRALTRLAFAVLACSVLPGCVQYHQRPRDAEPAAFVFRLGPGDRVLISVWKEDLSTETEIGPDGEISFPLIGKVRLAGRTLDEARVDLAELLKAHLKSPVVSVALKEQRSHQIHVMGEVYRPGSVPFVRGSNVLGAIQAAGSFIPATAAIDEVRVIRDRITTPRVFRIDIEKIVSAEDTDMYLEP
ncbi:polysaccharide export protein [bacterium]|nr:polysaccharide export protein [bacterium]